MISPLVSGNPEISRGPICLISKPPDSRLILGGTPSESMATIRPYSATESTYALVRNPFITAGLTRLCSAMHVGAGDRECHPSFQNYFFCKRHEKAEPGYRE